MAGNVVPLARAAPPAPPPLGHYIRAGVNDHRELMNRLAAGRRDFFGVVFSASYDA